MDIDPVTLTIADARKALHAGEFTALELARACLQAIERRNLELNAFITPAPELAVQAALQADALLARRPSNLGEIALLGIPLAVKDLFDTAGVLTTAGSRHFARNIPQEDAEAVKRLKLAGAGIVGKTNTHEIALGVTGVNPHYGAVNNPHDTLRISGGSSSGSAVAVATGMCLGALGTDTGGSVRIPAALCGVVGLKPTYGRVSTRGVLPLSWNLDHVGMLTHTVRDAGLLLQVLAGFDPHDPASVDRQTDDLLPAWDQDVGEWRVALAVGEYVEASDPRVLALVHSAAGMFKENGAQIEKVELSWIADLAQANGRMTQADAAAFHRQRLTEHPEWFGEDVRQRLEQWAALTSSDYALTRRVQSEVRRRLEMFFTKYDLLLLPTTPIPAPLQAGMQALDAARQLTRFTSPFNLTGLPALSLPCGAVDGMPVGLQIVSGPWQEAKVLRAGHAFEMRLMGRKK
jgi:aspartyl-tRNA(Asn)/glutamyl-tRNA(Gln) amidotransferase subunit A